MVWQVELGGGAAWGYPIKIRTSEIEVTIVQTMLWLTNIFY